MSKLAPMLIALSFTTIGAGAFAADQPAAPAAAQAAPAAPSASKGSVTQDASPKATAVQAGSTPKKHAHRRHRKATATATTSKHASKSVAPAKS